MHKLKLLLKPLEWLILLLVKIYQYLISPIFPASCRYTPT
ncbi:MAG: membrane protein insertion efficiency factor YidD, partial [Bacteroidia bacterium]